MRTSLLTQAVRQQLAEGRIVAARHLR